MDEFSSQFRWKNLNLNTELHVAGGFIYEGLFLIDRLSQLRYEDDYFQFLYSISVGIERLEKIAYLLTAHKCGDENPTTKWKKHDHPKLYQLINQHIELSYSERELAFLNVLKDFYVDGRYQRFNYNEDSLTPNKDKNLLLTFLRRYYNVKPQNFIGCEETIFLTKELKDLIGCTIQDIVIPLYDVICNTAHSLRLFTYEIRYASKAYKIFIEQEFSFLKELTAKRELIIKMINDNWNYDELINAIKSIEPLQIEQLTVDKYIGYLINNSTETDVKDEISQIYEDDNLGNRAEMIEFIGEDFQYESDQDFTDDI